MLCQNFYNQGNINQTSIWEILSAKNRRSCRLNHGCFRWKKRFGWKLNILHIEVINKTVISNIYLNIWYIRCIWCLNWVELVKPHILKCCLSLFTHLFKGFFPGFPCLQKKIVTNLLRSFWKWSVYNHIHPCTYLSISFLRFSNFLLNKLLKEWVDWGK